MEVSFDKTNNTYRCKVDLPSNALSREISKRMFSVFTARNSHIVCIKDFKTSKDLCVFIDEWFKIKSILDL